MKRNIAIFFIIPILMTGCSTVWKTLGVATVKSVEESNAEISQRIDQLEVHAASGDTALAKAEEIEKLVKELEGRMDELPADTLVRLADLIAKVAEEARNAAKN